MANGSRPTLKSAKSRRNVWLFDWFAAELDRSASPLLDRELVFHGEAVPVS